jgi:hypothetical protein
MAKDISLKDRDLNTAASYDVLLEVSNEAYELLDEANVGDLVKFEATAKESYTGNHDVVVVKPEYPFATDGAIVIENVTVDSINGQFKMLPPKSKIKVRETKGS